jgi:predicted TIM-barrel fold metal-dependent hydrolase
MRVDVHAWIGEYPWRALPTTGVGDLLSTMDAVGIDRAWVGSLPAAFRRDPRPDNEVLYRALAAHADRLAPAPTVHPDLPGWERDLNEAVAIGARAIRVYPCQSGIDPAGEAMHALANATAAAGLPLVLTVHFEDVRQRHPLDVAPELEASAVRALLRAVPKVQLVVAAARRPLIEEVHWGSTADESARVSWELSHLWGPPEDELARLVETVGAERFVFGTHWPLRVAEAAAAKLELLEVAPEVRALVEGENAQRLEE